MDKDFTSLQELPIADLAPNTVTDSHYIAGEVSLIWPYSSLTKQCSITLCDSDISRRLHKGQIRLIFKGKSVGGAIDELLNSGDKVKVALQGVQIVGGDPYSRSEYDSDWTGVWQHGVLIQINDAQPQSLIEDTAVEDITVSVDQVDSPSAASEPVWPTPAKVVGLRESEDNSLDQNVWFTPPEIVRRRLRPSSDDTFSSGAFLEYDDDLAGPLRKKSRHSRSSSEYRFETAQPDNASNVSTPQPVSSPIPSEPEFSRPLAASTPTPFARSSDTRTVQQEQFLNDENELYRDLMREKVLRQGRSHVREKSMMDDVSVVTQAGSVFDVDNDDRDQRSENLQRAQSSLYHDILQAKLQNPGPRLHVPSSAATVIDGLTASAEGSYDGRSVGDARSVEELTQHRVFVENASEPEGDDIIPPYGIPDVMANENQPEHVLETLKPDSPAVESPVARVEEVIEPKAIDPDILSTENLDSALLLGDDPVQDGPTHEAASAPEGSAQIAAGSQDSALGADRNGFRKLERPSQPIQVEEIQKTVPSPTPIAEEHVREQEKVQLSEEILAPQLPAAENQTPALEENGLSPRAVTKDPVQEERQIQVAEESSFPPTEKPVHQEENLIQTEAATTSSQVPRDDVLMDYTDNEPHSLATTEPVQSQRDAPLTPPASPRHHVLLQTVPDESNSEEAVTFDSLESSSVTHISEPSQHKVFSAHEMTASADPHGVSHIEEFLDEQDGEKSDEIFSPLVEVMMTPAVAKEEIETQRPSLFPEIVPFDDDDMEVYEASVEASFVEVTDNGELYVDGNQVVASKVERHEIVVGPGDIEYAEHDVDITELHSVVSKAERYEIVVHQNEVIYAEDDEVASGLVTEEQQESVKEFIYTLQTSMAGEGDDYQVDTEERVPESTYTQQVDDIDQAKTQAELDASDILLQLNNSQQQLGEDFDTQLEQNVVDFLETQGFETQLPGPQVEDKQGFSPKVATEESDYMVTELSGAVLRDMASQASPMQFDEAWDKSPVERSEDEDEDGVGMYPISNYGRDASKLEAASDAEKVEAAEDGESESDSIGSFDEDFEQTKIDQFKRQVPTKDARASADIIEIESSDEEGLNRAESSTPHTESNSNAIDAGPEPISSLIEAKEEESINENESNDEQEEESSSFSSDESSVDKDDGTDSEEERLRKLEENLEPPGPPKHHVTLETVTDESDSNSTPDRESVVGLETPISVYVPLNELSPAYHGLVDFIGVAVAISDVAKREVADGDVHYLRIELSDRSRDRLTVYVSRMFAIALPVIRVGEVGIFRNFSVKLKKNGVAAFSTQTSAWGVWKFANGPHSDPVLDVTGPAIETGKEETAYAVNLAKWYRGRS